MSVKDLKSKYFKANIGDFQNSFEFMGMTYEKVEDLRYGTNPHQGGAIYRPKRDHLTFGQYETLKSGKGGLSQTNVEDLNYAVKILKYMTARASVVMKHLNPSGASVATQDESLKQVYINARDADPQAAFGGVVAFNEQGDAETADEIMSSVIEVVAAPDFTQDAIDIFHDFPHYKRNKHIRILKLSNIKDLAKFVDDKTPVKEAKILQDGSIILSDPYLTKIRNRNDLIQAYNQHKDKGDIKCERTPTNKEYKDLLFSWYVNLSVRSNGVVIVKNGITLAVGTGEQDRVGAVEQAILKAKNKYKGKETLEGAVISSDGFFPFRDSIDRIAGTGIKAIVQPGGSVSDYPVIEACNEHGLAMVFTDERCFSHH
ncbi:MAG TPA: IMP cyclohydrolase [Spirochaetes bacterium]|nr:IMP cyclohydrolase [Spirochaetota bacterium]